ncbi:type III PLP-dependent enzyme [Paenibacillus sp. WLX2291]|uniref:type III PLP-dependent enzyme n=1 Tax=Paenibacillus sp. WLX2291 TaxID=3296934 RepID=UPI0039844F83
MRQAVTEVIQQIQDSSREPVCAYVYDLVSMQEHVQGMLQSLPTQCWLFYAIKANPDPHIIRSLLPLVGGFEVASIGELMKVREISRDVPILFGGPGKKEYELEQAIRQHVYCLHVESLLELRRIIYITRRLQATEGSAFNEPTRIMLRINLHSGELPQTKITMGGRATPFGLDEGLLEEALSIVIREGAGAVKLSGFHFHSLSNNPDAELHAEMVGLYMQKAAQWQQQYELEPLELINAGGGFGVSYDEQTPDFDWKLFTSLVVELPLRELLPQARLIFEPGRMIVADYGYYVAEVSDLKVSHEQNFAVLRGGTHHNRLPASWGHNHPFLVMASENWSAPWARSEIRQQAVHLVGELCTPKDRMHSDAMVEHLRVGDLIVFVKSGAYCWTISHHDFLGHPHPEFYYITKGSDGDHGIIGNDGNAIWQTHR